MNKVFLLGNLGRDPELRYSAAGKAVANFSLAVNEKYGDNQKTTWVTIVAWDKLAENCANHLRKGSKVLVEGKLSIRDWEDQDGKKHKTTEIIASSVHFFGGVNSGQAKPNTEDDLSGISLDDLPF